MIPRTATIPVALAREAATDGQPMAVCVYAALDGLYGQCVAGIWPGQKRLAVQLGIAHRTVQRALEWLDANGWVSITARTGANGARTTNAYELHPDAATRREWNTPEARARQRTRIDRELYARAVDKPHVTGDVGPTSQTAHNPYLPRRSNYAALLEVVENPDAEEIARVRAGPLAEAFRHTKRQTPPRAPLGIVQ